METIRGTSVTSPIFRQTSCAVAECRNKHLLTREYVIDDSLAQPMHSPITCSADGISSPCPRHQTEQPTLPSHRSLILLVEQCSLAIELGSPKHASYAEDGDSTWPLFKKNIFLSIWCCRFKYLILLGYTHCELFLSLILITPQ